MKPKDENLAKNISRLVKLAGDSNKPSKAFSDSLAEQALVELEQRSQPKRTRMFSFRKPAWIGAAAAVLVVGILLLVSHSQKGRMPSGEFAQKPGTPAAPKIELERRARITAAPAPVEKGAAKKALALGSAKEKENAVADLRGVAAGKIAEAAVPEKAPFAPASAIELVTLPRRDKVQLTIYNSTFQSWYGYGGYSGGYGGYGGYGGGYRYGERSGDLDKAARKEIEKLNEAVRKGIEKRGRSDYLPYGRSGEIGAGDLTLVRERRNLTLKKGWNWLQFMWANTLIDPTSLSLEPLEQADKIDIQQLVFPARLRELGRWLIRSEIEGQVPFEITYFTSGLSWRAFYMGTLSQDEKTMQLAGYVRVANKSGEDYEKAQTRLIVGKVHILDQIAELAKRQYPYGRPMPFDRYGGGFGGYGGAFKRAEIMDMSEGLEMAFYDYDDEKYELRRKEIKKEGLSEYFLYTIEGTETIPDKWGKRLLSFEAEDVNVTSLYKYDEERWGPQTIRFVSFANDEEHNLGETPIPNGTVKIYRQADGQEYLSYVGGTSVKYIPVDEEVELNLGPARLVSVEPILMDFKTDNYVFDRKNNISGWDEIQRWKIEVMNTRMLPVEIEITRGFDTTYWTLQAGDKEVSWEKHDAEHARFNLELEPQTKRTFRYTVRTYHGVREEALTEKQSK